MGRTRNRDFTQAEIDILSKNKNVKKVSSKQITYEDSFKELFINEHNAGKLPRDIFIENGFDSEYRLIFMKGKDSVIYMPIDYIHSLK